MIYINKLFSNHSLQSVVEILKKFLKGKEMATAKDIRVHLKQELKRRMFMNPSYSLRAFARSLEVSRSFLSKLLKGERSTSLQMLLKIGKRLNLEQSQIENFRYHQLKVKQKAKQERLSRGRS